MTNLTAPKAAEKFIADAEAAGYQVKVTATEQEFNVWVQVPNSQANGAAVWEVVNTAGANSVLGFVTTYKRGVRFTPSTVRDSRGNYHYVKSLRQVRGHLGMEVD